jgi:hypothetical protein
MSAYRDGIAHSGFQTLPPERKAHAYFSLGHALVRDGDYSTAIAAYSDGLRHCGYQNLSPAEGGKVLAGLACAKRRLNEAQHSAAAAADSLSPRRPPSVPKGARGMGR